MRHDIGTFICSAGLAAALFAGAKLPAIADDLVLAATFNPSEDAGVTSLPAYVPIDKLGIFLIAAWKTMPSSTSRVETGTVAARRPSDAAVAITPVNAKSDEIVVQPADVAPVDTSGSVVPQSKDKDTLGQVVPSVSKAKDVASGKAALPPPPLKRLASLSKPRSKRFGRVGVYRDWQVGIPGQSMEPLISMCAQAPRKCSARVEFCGC